MRYDAIIIGSGLGGLEVALMLSKVGKRVIVLEKQRQAGGCMQSFRRGTMHLDTGLHYVGGLGEGESLRIAFESLGLMQLPWQRMDEDCFEEIIFPSGKFCWCQGIDAFIHQMKSYFPHEDNGLEQYRNLLLSNDEEFMQKTNAWDYLHSIFTDELLIQVLSAPATCKMELRKESLPLFTFVHGIAPFIESSWRLKGDGNLIVNRLVSQITDNGGEVLTGKEVVELIEEDGRVVRAVCADSTEYEASIFVSDTHPVLTTHLLRQSRQMKGIFRRRIEAQDNTAGIFTLQLKLKPRSLKYFNHNKLVFAHDNCWNMAVGESHTVEGIMISSRIPSSGEYVDNIDILTPMTWDAVMPWQESKIGHRHKAYKQMKQEVAQACIRLASTAIPNLEDIIQKEWSSTPLTYRDYNGTPCGSAFGFRKDYTSPLTTIVSPRTPVPNLYMTGQSLMLHGLQGVTMTAGFTIRAIQD